MESDSILHFNIRILHPGCISKLCWKWTIICDLYLQGRVSEIQPCHSLQRAVLFWVFFLGGGGSNIRNFLSLRNMKIAWTWYSSAWLRTASEPDYFSCWPERHTCVAPWHYRAHVWRLRLTCPGVSYMTASLWTSWFLRRCGEISWRLFGPLV